MIYRLTIPVAGEEGLAEVRVLEWHFPPGGPVKKGELLVELETEKSIIEVRAGRDAVLQRILVPAGEWAKLGQVVAILSDTADEAVAEDVGALDEYTADYDVV